MAKSSAEIRGLVNDANQIVEEGQVLLRQAREKFTEGRTRYMAITEKLEPSVRMLQIADQSMEEALTHSMSAVSEANVYSSVI